MPLGQKPQLTMNNPARIIVTTSASQLELAPDVIASSAAEPRASAATVAFAVRASALIAASWHR
jgi:hypothetical protein